MKKLLGAALLCALSGFTPAGNLEPYTTVPTTFPAGFEGNDLPGVIDTIKAHAKELGLVKSEFTTTDEYSSAMAKAANSLNFGKHWLFTIPAKTLAGGMSRYNADAGVFELKPFSFTVDGEYHDALRGFTFKVDADGPSGRQYQASNAFGASVTVTEIHSHHYMLTFWNDRLPRAIENMRDRHDKGLFKMVVPVPPAEAAQIGDDLVAIFVCKIMPPVMFSFDERRGPTLDFHYDSTVNTDALVVDIERVIFINGKTGKVYFTS